jgi:hypothetical protein
MPGIIRSNPLGSSIETSEITDGAVTNDKVNAAAAIALSKLAETVVKSASGTYTGDGAATGVAQSVAFRPKLVLVINESDNDFYFVWDLSGAGTAQNGFKETGAAITPETGTGVIEITASGFTPKGAGQANQNAKSYRWTAFAW